MGRDEIRALLKTPAWEATLFTAEEKRQPEIRQRGISMHHRLAISTFLTFCSKLVLRVPCCGKKGNLYFLKHILNRIKYNNLDLGHSYVNLEKFFPS